MTRELFFSAEGGGARTAKLLHHIPAVSRRGWLLIASSGQTSRDGKGRDVAALLWKQSYVCPQKTFLRLPFPHFPCFQTFLWKVRIFHIFSHGSVSAFFRIYLGEEPYACSHPNSMWICYLAVCSRIHVVEVMWRGVGGFKCVLLLEKFPLIWVLSQNLPLLTPSRKGAHSSGLGRT